MKINAKWIIKNFITTFLYTAFYLGVSIFMSIFLTEIFELAPERSVGISYTLFLVSYVIRVYFEQKRDIRQDYEHFKDITIHFTILNIITYIPVTLILFFILRGGPIIAYTRLRELIIIYDLIYVSVINSAVIAAILDFLTVGIMLIAANYLAFVWHNKNYPPRRKI